MSRALPILFNTDMVRAILDKRKGATRRIVPGEIILCPEMEHKVYFKPHKPRKDRGREIKSIKYFTLQSFIKNEAPYQPGDILYVRETWTLEEFYDDEALIRFKAGGNIGIDYECEGDTYSKLLKYADKKWNPSLFMPKEAARIFLKVKDVRVERLQHITEDGIRKEGVDVQKEDCVSGFDYVTELYFLFQRLWDFTIQKTDLKKFGWKANPWVWVIEFERCEKPEEW